MSISSGQPPGQPGHQPVVDGEGDKAVGGKGGGHIGIKIALRNCVSLVTGTKSAAVN
ncbi:MAG: hypothetical protein WDN00_15225 [Limisphaerales bacterium]